MINGSDFIVFAFNARITIQGIVGVRPDDTGNSRTCHKGSNLDQSHTLEGVSQQMIYSDRLICIKSEG
jgi:hypothetical protein